MFPPVLSGACANGAGIATDPIPTGCFHRRPTPKGSFARRSRRHPVPSGGSGKSGDRSLPTWRFRNRFCLADASPGFGSFNWASPAIVPMPSAPAWLFRFSGDRPVSLPSVRHHLSPKASERRVFQKRGALPPHREVDEPSVPFHPLRVVRSGSVPPLDNWKVRLLGESHKGSVPHLSTFLRFASGQGWISQRLTAFSEILLRQRGPSRLASSRRRSAFNLMKPSASFWS